MLVYANQLRVEGTDAEEAVFRAIGGWLKEQLGFGLHPDQLTQDGEFNGHRGERRSRLRIHGCYDCEPALCAWVLKHVDDDVHGRRWIVEAGVKKFAGTLEMSCVVKTDERSALVSSPVSASQPRVIRYLTRNVRSAKDAAFPGAVPGEILRTVGQNSDSYRGLLAEIERRDRDSAIVLPVVQSVLSDPGCAATLSSDELRGLSPLASRTGPAIAWRRDRARGRPAGQGSGASPASRGGW